MWCKMRKMYTYVYKLEFEEKYEDYGKRKICGYSEKVININELKKQIHRQNK